jgi:hypothetical protein
MLLWGALSSCFSEQILQEIIDLVYHLRNIIVKWGLSEEVPAALA